MFAWTERRCGEVVDLAMLMSMQMPFSGADGSSLSGASQRREGRGSGIEPYQSQMRRTAGG